jgi:tRNA-2-methylthio-N6-dimethylallyladenosine synthase
LERVRFMSPHPAAFTDDVIDAMVETPNVMPHLHMPLQSGSNQILKAMKRSYRSDKYLGILDRVRNAIPDASITTDIIVGFPSETEEDFQDTMRVVTEAKFAMAYTYQYSIRPGTPAGEMENQIPKEIVQDRYERLIAHVNEIAWQENKKQLGKTVEVLVANQEGRKDQQTQRLTGRARDNRLVHFETPANTENPRPGDLVSVTVTDAKPYFLFADNPGDGYSIRPTRAGDAHERFSLASCSTDSSAPSSVSLGFPTVRLK